MNENEIDRQLEFLRSLLAVMERDSRKETNPAINREGGFGE
jgi:hypothetical protein